MSERESPRRKGDDWDPDAFSVPASPRRRSWEPDPAEPREPEPALDVKMKEPEEKDPRVKKGIFALLLVAILIVPVGFYMAAVPAVPAAASAAPEEVVEEEEPPPPNAGARRVAPVGGGRGGGRSGGGFYREAGDLSDVVCRPRANEAEQVWRSRVPRHCLSNYRSQR
jgi:hypothetical protein